VALERRHLETATRWRDLRAALEKKVATARLGKHGLRGRGRARANLRGRDRGLGARLPRDVSGEVAAKRPLDTETLAAQLGRLGETSYELATLDNQLEGACHFPLSALNQLRRDLIAKLERGGALQAPSEASTNTLP
jgi:hypothetical protein